MKFRDVVATEAEERALNAVGVAGFAGHFPRQLFGGTRQWASLARALSLDTPIILMDELFTAIDEQTRMILGKIFSNY
ncbi:ABC transporter (plasmid) [Rhizobium rhizogenes K84]|uniref:ABC transporter n=1 Tax=Rhizobium rhizogenes (strain K84 / ATCC BAA-868) TaxID=311403 RepID=B9JQ80_RHIR8|nr:ABC transporter [Rhizobium rhizogenes K84]